MNTIFLIIFLILTIKANPESNISCENEEIVAYGASDCKYRKIEQTENEDFCCFVHYINKYDMTTKGCAAISKDDYYKINDIVKSYERIQEIKIKSFDCKSGWIKNVLVLSFVIIALTC